MDSFREISSRTSNSNIIGENENNPSSGEKSPSLHDVPSIERVTSMHIESKDTAQKNFKNESLSQLSLPHKNIIKIEVKPFREISINLENIHRKLRDTEIRASEFHKDYNILKKDKNKLSDSKFLQDTSKWIASGKTVGAVNNMQEIKEYQSIQENRENSGLENILDKNSDFRWLLSPVNGAFRDNSTGLYAELIFTDFKKNNYLLCFPGTGAGDMLQKNWSTNINQVLRPNEIPAAYQQAYELAKEIKEKIENKGGSIQLSGHSLGGGIANYVGLKLNIESYCFNAAALGGGCQEDLKNELTADRLEKQIHITQKGDIVSSNKTQNKIAAIANFTNTKIVTPKNIGIVYKIKPVIPEINLNPFKRHLLGSFNKVFDNPGKFNINFQPNQDQGDTQFSFIEPKTSTEKKSSSSADRSVSDPPPPPQPSTTSPQSLASTSFTPISTSITTTTTTNTTTTSSTSTTSAPSATSTAEVVIETEKKS